MNKELKEEQNKLQDIIDKINSGEINEATFDMYCEVYPELRYANYIANTIKIAVTASYAFLIVYFFTH